MSFSKEQFEYIQKCFRFSDRETQVLKLMFEGLDNKKIAKRLGLRYNTVKAHFSNIYKLTGAKSKSDLIVHLVKIMQNQGKM